MIQLKPLHDRLVIKRIEGAEEPRGGLYSIRVSRESAGKNYCSKENGGVRNGNSYYACQNR
jgi:co-chaperonin GroES (HSP10)